MEAFATEHDIPFERCGKLVVALDASELERFEGLRQRAEANGVPGLEVVGPERMRELEPHAAGIKALWSPTTGIIDYRRVALAIADEVRARGGAIHTSPGRDRHHRTWLRAGAGDGDAATSWRATSSPVPVSRPIGSRR